MLESTRIGLKVDVDTLRGTREGVPRLMALFKKHGVDATFYFSVGPDHTGRAMRRVFRKGFAQKVARTSVLKHYGLKTLLYGVLLPGPDIGKSAGAVMRSVHDAGFEVGLHTYDHVRWQDYVAEASAAWTRTEFERGIEAFERVFGFLPQSHAAAGWQINAHALELEQEYGLRYASDTRGGPPFFPVLAQTTSSCPQLPTTLPTFDELLGVDGIDESTIADAVFRLSAASANAAGAAGAAGAAVADDLQVFTLHAELEGMLLLDAFESLLVKWRQAGASITRMAAIHERALRRPLPARAVVMGEVAGRSGLLAVQAEGAAAAGNAPAPASAAART
ncbi:MAG: undecaprenyl phosphate-alpha-L-ara4FN deformylase [Gammaproteobacteria bacterium]|jgi:peptidoglycan/xylan/chitin deacetylase (PgdA/CDA1 family)|nr:undecaprenyl phosphate-alpha-L-ara4FN deformylase [Gammaproteobacteria bacterium]